jgi:hypothetical protein
MVDDGNFQTPFDKIVRVDSANIAVKLSSGYAFRLSQVKPRIRRNQTDIQRKLAILFAATAAGPGMLHRTPMLQD